MIVAVHRTYHNMYIYARVVHRIYYIKRVRLMCYTVFQRKKYRLHPLFRFMTPVSRPGAIADLHSNDSCAIRQTTTANNACIYERVNNSHRHFNYNTTNLLVCFTRSFRACTERGVCCLGDDTLCYVKIPQQVTSKKKDKKFDDFMTIIIIICQNRFR